MPRERHQYRAREVNQLIDGETHQARQHHALVNDGVVVSKLLPSGSKQYQSEATLEQQKKAGGKKLKDAKVVFIAHEEDYQIKNRRGKITRHNHGITDGLENRVREQSLPSLQGNWLEGGGGYDSRRRKHDWQVAPYRDPK